MLKGAVKDANLLASMAHWINQTVKHREPNAFRRVESVRAVAEHPKILEYVRMLSGRKASPFQTLNFKQGTQQPAHSDLIHFSTFPQGMMLAVWVALEDIHNDSGPLVMYPGSHRADVAYYEDLEIWAENESWEGPYRQYEERLQARVLAKLPPPRSVLLQRGDAFVWAANLYHGGSPIRDPSRTRMSQVTHYWLEGANSYWIPKMSCITQGQIVTTHGPELWKMTSAKVWRMRQRMDKVQQRCMPDSP